MRQHKQTTGRLRQFAGSVCVAAYLLGGVTILPEFLALGAWLEGSHAVQVSVSEDQTTVVLSHQRLRPDTADRPNPVHHHGAAAQAICFFAISQNSQDHIARFSPTQITESAVRIAKVLPERPVCQMPGTLNQDPEGAASFVLARKTRATPPPIDSLTLHQSTVLVI